MELERRREGSVEILTLNRPEQRNALSPELITQLGEAFTETAADDDVRVLVITAAGDRAFCSGMDLKSFAASRESGETRGGSGSAEAYSNFTKGSYPKPVIGAANGTAVAGGFELLLACDLIVAADHVRFGLAEVKRGLFAAGGGVLLPTRIPLAVALEIGLTGEQFPATRALELGLINRIVPAAELLPAALELAAKVAANGPLGVAATKRMMYAAATRGADAVAAIAPEEHARVFGSEDALEGARAFAEKRDPVFKGR